MGRDIDMYVPRTLFSPQGFCDLTQADSSLVLRCAGCRRERPRGWFTRAGEGRRDSWCRECRAQGASAKAARRRGAGVRSIPRGLRQRLFDRQRGICAQCGGYLLTLAGTHVDHRVPVCKGGVHAEDNLQLLHARCNLAKGRR